MIIYLGGLLPNRSCDFGDERATLLSHILHRVEFTATMCRHTVGCALTTPFHPCPLQDNYLASWRFISVALFRRSPWIDVINYACSMVLGLSSPLNGAIIWLTSLCYFNTIIYFCQGCK